jgi:hypothetical protein
MTKHFERKISTRNQLLGTVIGLVLAAVVFLPVDMYLGYRRLMAQINATEIKDVFIPDMKLGWVPKPRSIGINRSPGNFDVRYHIDENGFKTVPFKGRAAMRIFFFGDSYTFGHGVTNSDTFANIIAADYVTPQVQVINTGATGYGLIQMYGRFLEIADRLKKNDIVVFAPISSNLRRNLDDFVFVGQFIFLKKQLNVTHFPQYVDGSLKPVKLDTLLNRFKTLLFYARFSGRISIRLYRMLLKTDRMDEARAMLNTARTLTQKKGAHFVLIFLPSSTECLKGRYDVDLSGFDYIDPRHYFPTRASGLKNITFPRDPHWNPKGHALVARAMVDILVTQKKLAVKYLSDSHIKISGNDSGK